LCAGKVDTELDPPEFIQQSMSQTLSAYDGTSIGYENNPYQSE
jgi:hypothetical protein